jgi:hypothetical protein
LCHGPPDTNLLLLSIPSRYAATRLVVEFRQTD